MARNLKYQLKTAIEKNFKEGMDKHSIKANGGDGTKIFSYSDRKNLINFTSNFSNWMKFNYPEVKLAKDINSNHVQSFLNSKAQDCSRATLKQYVSKANKMAKLINNTYNQNLKFNVVAPVSKSSNQPLRNKQMEVNHYNKLISKMRDGNGKNALMITKNFGLRVSELTKLQGRDIDLDKGVIRVVGGKGGRDREVPIRTLEQREVAQKLKATVSQETDRIVPIKQNSVNMALSRAMDKIGVGNEYSDTGIHSIRKLYAQEQYNYYRSSGMEINQALGEVSRDLGHSLERGKDMDLMCIYIKNIF
ncbi:tyrosine-type recombinase/integrase [Clostridium perfringens]|uniref:tyrosine-type recombinase/integrase n=1 Tax=Clostridium perfringens TaxID=1502 RepID=UPI0018E3FB5F|nr:site-specific integrase [Clostridium perfringens]MBI6051760.1 tyrosine-type recombinase/integrase [Clostridium perfringens]MDM0528848.1 site-specific integrase [Clostridium perfringens]MDM0531827.1 site-specific integrase [Clostridium perfringens]